MNNYKEDFKGKYTRKNPLGKILINNFYKTLEKIASQIETNNALEVACGHGFSTQRLAKSFKNLEASEYLEEIIDDARQLNPGMKIIRESIYDLQREDNSFDLIFALEVMEHLDEPEKALAELKRVTKKYCIISVPNEPIFRILNMARGAYLKDFGNTPGHINHWSKKSMTKLLSKYFKIKKVYTPLPWIVVLVEK